MRSVIVYTGKKKGLAPQPSSESSNSEKAGPGRSSSVTPFAGAKLHIEDENEDSDDDSQDEEDAFIVEDDTVAPELPPEFSMDTHQDLAHQFKIICQFFVRVALHQVEERHHFMEDTMKSERFVEPRYRIRLILLLLRYEVLFCTSTNCTPQALRIERFFGRFLCLEI